MRLELLLMLVWAQLFPDANGALLPVNVLEALVIRIRLRLVPSAVPSGVFAAPALRMRRILVLLGLLVLILTHAVPHGCELSDLIPRGHTALLLRAEH